MSEGGWNSASNGAQGQRYWRGCFNRRSECASGVFVGGSQSQSLAQAWSACAGVVVGIAARWAGELQMGGLRNVTVS